MSLCYKDEATFYKVESDGYSNNKSVDDSAVVPVIFLQNTGFIHASNQENIDSDGVVYPDFTHEFIEDNHMRLEGMYIKIETFGSSPSWYKVTKCIVNRDHLLNNQIDNIQLLLKKTRPLNVI